MDEARRRPWLALLLALTFTGAPGTSRADTVRMKDGSVIHGEILKIKDDELTIDTEYADEVSIEVEHIVDIEAERSFTIQYKDGSRADGQISISPEGKLIVTEKTPDVSGEGTPASTDEAPAGVADAHADTTDTAPPAPLVPPTAVAAPPVAEPTTRRAAGMAYDVAPPAAALGIETPVEDVALGPPVIDVNDVRWLKQYETYYRYTAELNVGLEVARGNTDTTAFHFDTLLEPSFGLNTISLSGQYDKQEADGVTTTNQWRAEGGYRRRFKRRWYAFGVNRWQADTQQDLDLRILTGAGPGYYFYEDDPTHLSLQGGVAYVVENFSGTTNDRDFAAFMWTTDFERDLYKDDITFYHNHNFIDSFEDFNNFLVQTATGIKFDIWGGFILSGEVQFDWTNKPAAGKKQDDTRYYLKIGYEVEGDETDWWQP